MIINATTKLYIAYLLEIWSISCLLLVILCYILLKLKFFTISTNIFDENFVQSIWIYSNCNKILFLFSCCCCYGFFFHYKKNEINFKGMKEKVSDCEMRTKKLSNYKGKGILFILRIEGEWIIQKPPSFTTQNHRIYVFIVFWCENDRSKVWFSWFLLFFWLFLSFFKKNKK